MRREREIQLRENQFKANGSANPQERQQLRWTAFVRKSNA